MINVTDLLQRRTDLNARLDFALITQAKATEKRIREELEIIELALTTLKRIEFNDS